MLNPGVVGVVHQRSAESTPHPGPVTRSRPLARPEAGLRLRRIPFAASQAAQVPVRGGEGEVAFFRKRVGNVFQENEAKAESFRTDTIVSRHYQMGCRHCLLGGGPKLGLKIQAGIVGWFLIVAFGHTECGENSGTSGDCKAEIEGVAVRVPRVFVRRRPPARHGPSRAR